MDWNTYRQQLQTRRRIAFRRLSVAAIILFNLYLHIMMELFDTDPPPTRLAYHTSALTGAQWVMELITGHPRRIRTELGVSHFVFEQLLQEMSAMGRGPSRHVLLEEQLAIFLYMVVTGNTIRHTGERFQRSNETIAKYLIIYAIFSNH